MHESVTEEISSGGSPSTRYSRLEHHWSVSVAPGGLVQFHVEGYRTTGTDGDTFAFEYSTDGGSSWLPIALADLPLADDGIDLQADLPPSLSGASWIRVVDTNRDPGAQSLDTVWIDELFVRSVP